MDHQRTFSWTTPGGAAGQAGGGRAARKRKVQPAGLPFLVRWVVAVAAAVLLAGFVEFAVARQQIVDRGLQDSLRNYGALAEEIEAALAADPDPKTQEAAAAAEVDHIGHSYGTVYVGLFAGDGRLIAESGMEAGKTSPDPARLTEVASTGTAAVEGEEHEGEEDGHREGYEFLIPVTAPGGTLVLHIDQHPDIIGELVADQGQRTALGLLLAVVCSIPLSYMLGGRTLHRRHVRAQREADEDALTGLAGRRPFRPALETALSRRAGVPVTLALLDLDNFKRINDRLGHSHGDRVLTGLADSFAELRATDTAFRLGGDEFAVILPGRSEQGALEALERVRAAMIKKFPGVTFSAGIASSAGSDPTGLQELWERADAALYEAKRRGRRQSVTFQSMAVGHTVSAEKIEALTALVAGDAPIAVAFQPIWDLHRGVVLAHEALLRLPMDSPISGPQEAFDLAERLGLAAALDAQAREAILTAVKSRAWAGLLFMNIHPDALAHLDLAAFTAALTEAGLEPEDVVLEVTEQAGLDHPEPIRSLTRAHERGFRLALDDMGRSNAGLRALTLVRFDIIKIDGEVISRLGTDPSSAATVAAALTFVEQTGGWVVAEGIEEQRMLTALLQPGEARSGRKTVLAGQGYLLGRPAPRPVGLDTHIQVLDKLPSRAEADDPVADSPVHGKP
jgi:diguanylate cyclase (GGDEF)-like protein